MSDDLFDQAEQEQTSYNAGQDADDFLMAESTPSAFRKHHTLGTVIQGTILSKNVRPQTDYGTGKNKFYEDGNQAMQLVVVIQTELREQILDPKTGNVKVTQENDNGQRAVYIKGQMKAATRDAVRAVGARGLELGGTLAVKWDSEKPSGKGNPIKVYKVRYSPPGTAPVAQKATAAKATGTMQQIKAAAAKAKAAAASEPDDAPPTPDDDPGF